MLAAPSQSWIRSFEGRFRYLHDRRLVLPTLELRGALGRAGHKGAAFDNLEMDDWARLGARSTANARCELGQLLEVPRGSLREDTKLHRAWVRLGWRGPGDPLEARAASHVTLGHATLLLPSATDFRRGLRDPVEARCGLVGDTRPRHAAENASLVSGVGPVTRQRRITASYETLGRAGDYYRAANHPISPMSGARSSCWSSVRSRSN
jgi:hypothetical protein